MRTQTTIHWRTAGTLRATALLIATLLVLGGCSATHVGDAWQCPVAQGTACTTVKEVDPAVTAAGKVRGIAIPEPPGRTGADDAGRPGAACAGNCDPLAWLAGWFGAPEERHDGTVKPDSALPAGEIPDVSEGLRTKERIARIWIAPFVDSGGVYREGHWVRAVLEPSRWRLR